MLPLRSTTAIKRHPSWVALDRGGAAQRGDTYGDASLLTYGFAHYHPALLVSAGESFVTEAGRAG